MSPCAALSTSVTISSASVAVSVGWGEGDEEILKEKVGVDFLDVEAFIGEWLESISCAGHSKCTQ